MNSDPPPAGDRSACAVAELLRPVAEALDGLGIACCLFDAADDTLLWNRTFLAFFPEQAGAIGVGTPYAENLRRFYGQRLDAREMPSIDRYIAEGVARHRAQQRPFGFSHDGRQLQVASLPLPGLGRIRLWREEAPTDGAGAAVLGRLPEPLEIDGAALFDHVAEGIMVTGADERIAWVNASFVGLYGLADRRAAQGLGFEEIYRLAWSGAAPSPRVLFETGLATLGENMRFAGAPFELPLPEARWVRVVAQRGPDGRGFFAHVDITVLKRQQQQLLTAERRARESEALLRQKSTLLEVTLERMEQGILMVNAQRVVEVCNRRAMQLLDLPESLMASRPSFQAVLDYQMAQGEFDRTPIDVLTFIRSGGILGTSQRYERERPDGRVIEIFSVPLEGGGMVRTYTDITERRRSEARIRHLARHDGLTGLVNREFFLESLAEALDRAGAEDEVFAVHYIDIDLFKPINDRFGHSVGDQVLVKMAERMREVARGGEVLARLGGDEFALLQSGGGGVDADEARGLAVRLLAALERPMDIEGHRLTLGASIGIALYPEAGRDADLLLRHADQAMYAAKAHGAVCVQVYADDLPAIRSSGSLSG
ncbi:PAS-domain containing protein [Variovorax sp. ZT4R33]|uniref:PAS-domain containing protein n=1 Tax=Variovorax sp. ZT4R33 TaxID=3443743 RepID=UPI003F45FB65